jgi:hypothetical protein
MNYMPLGPGDVLQDGDEMRSKGYLQTWEEVWVSMDRSANILSEESCEQNYYRRPIPDGVDVTMEEDEEDLIMRAEYDEDHGVFGLRFGRREKSEEERLREGIKDLQEEEIEICDLMLAKLNTVEPNTSYTGGTSMDKYLWIFKPKERGVLNAEVSLEAQLQHYRKGYDIESMYRHLTMKVIAGSIQLDLKQDYGREHPPLGYGVLKYVMDADRRAEEEEARIEKERRQQSLNMVKALFDIPMPSEKRKITLPDESGNTK